MSTNKYYTNIQLYVKNYNVIVLIIGQNNTPQVSHSLRSLKKSILNSRRDKGYKYKLKQGTKVNVINFLNGLKGNI